MGKHSSGQRLDSVKIKDQGKVKQSKPTKVYGHPATDKVAVVRSGSRKHGR